MIWLKVVLKFGIGFRRLIGWGRRSFGYLVYLVVFSFCFLGWFCVGRWRLDIIIFLELYVIVFY